MAPEDNSCLKVKMSLSNTRTIHILIHKNSEKEKKKHVLFHVSVSDRPELVQRQHTQNNWQLLTHIHSKILSWLRLFITAATGKPKIPQEEWFVSS